MRGSTRRAANVRPRGAAPSRAATAIEKNNNGPRVGRAAANAALLGEKCFSFGKGQSAASGRGRPLPRSPSTAQTRGAQRRLEPPDGGHDGGCTCGGRDRGRQSGDVWKHQPRRLHAVLAAAARRLSLPEGRPPRRARRAGGVFFGTPAPMRRRRCACPLPRRSGGQAARRRRARLTNSGRQAATRGVKRGGRRMHTPRSYDLPCPSMRFHSQRRQLPPPLALTVTIPATALANTAASGQHPSPPPRPGHAACVHAPPTRAPMRRCVATGAAAATGATRTPPRKVQAPPPASRSNAPKSTSPSLRATSTAPIGTRRWRGTTAAVRAAACPRPRRPLVTTAARPPARGPGRGGHHRRSTGAAAAPRSDCSVSKHGRGETWPQ